MTKRTRAAIGLTLLFLAGCSRSLVNTPLPEPTRPVLPDQPPAAEREFRGLWVATANNIDWPSRRGLDPRRQQAELIAILDRAAQLHLNAIILQVRPSCDALYDSKIEPWSEYLTGTMGLAPSPYYDPLAFAVAEAHKRGLELHAWFNPFRVRFRELKTAAAPNHVSRAHPELVRAVGSYLWLDPGDPRARGHSLSVILDVVRRYDIDGVHLDDYFYPYPEKDYKAADFPDNALWQRYQRQGGKLSRGDWRRENINTFIRVVYASIKKEKPWVKFGVSPFGIWRPGRPAQTTTTGFDAYELLFADSRTWLASGWVDYFSPQLYWPSEKEGLAFAPLLNWWSAQNSLHRHLWPGMEAGGWPGFNGNQAAETAKEIDLTRRQPGASGDLLWHAGPILRNTGGVADALARAYSVPALVPASPWLGGLPPDKPSLTIRKGGDGMILDFKSSGGGPVWQWLLQEETGDYWTTQILSGAQTSRLLRTGPGAAAPRTIALTAVSRVGKLSPPAVSKVELR
jgi:uncharacterized lipoprotein YddW (UPF0748 family)